MERVFLDTNIIIDILEEREPFVDESRKLMELYFEYCISAVTVQLAWYVSKPRSINQFRQFIDQYELIEVNSDIVQKAFELDLKDFEDSIQIASFLGKCDYFVTRDKDLIKQFKNLIPIYTPAEFLKKQDK